MTEKFKDKREIVKARFVERAYEENSYKTDSKLILQHSTVKLYVL